MEHMHFQFYQVLPNYFLECLCQFILLPTLYENFHCFKWITLKPSHTLLSFREAEKYGCLDLSPEQLNRNFGGWDPYAIFPPALLIYKKLHISYIYMCVCNLMNLDICIYILSWHHHHIKLINISIISKSFHVHFLFSFFWLL